MGLFAENPPKVVVKDGMAKHEKPLENKPRNNEDDALYRIIRQGWTRYGAIKTKIEAKRRLVTERAAVAENKLLGAPSILSV